MRTSEPSISPALLRLAFFGCSGFSLNLLNQYFTTIETSDERDVFQESFSENPTKNTFKFSDFENKPRAVGVLSLLRSLDSADIVVASTWGQLNMEGPLNGSTETWII